jgi:hypothetical protein
MLPFPGFCPGWPEIPLSEDAMGGPKGSGRPDMLMGAVELPFPELLEAVLLLWDRRYLAEVADTEDTLPTLWLALALRPAALLAGS